MKRVETYDCLIPGNPIDLRHEVAGTSTTYSAKVIEISRPEVPRVDVKNSLARTSGLVNQLTSVTRFDSTSTHSTATSELLERRAHKLTPTS